MKDFKTLTKMAMADMTFSMPLLLNLHFQMNLCRNDLLRNLKFRMNFKERIQKLSKDFQI